MNAKLKNPLGHPSLAQKVTGNIFLYNVLLYSGQTVQYVWYGAP